MTIKNQTKIIGQAITKLKYSRRNYNRKYLFPLITITKHTVPFRGFRVLVIETNLNDCKSKTLTNLNQNTKSKNMYPTVTKHTDACNIWSYIHQCCFSIIMVYALV